MRCGSNFVSKCGEAGRDGWTGCYYRFAGGGVWGAAVFLPGIQNLMKLKFSLRYHIGHVVIQPFENGNIIIF